MAIRKADPKLIEFLSAYDGRIAELALALRRMVLKEAPSATEMVYDAYNAVAIGFTFSGRLKEGFCHVAAYSGHVNLGFNRGTELPDPQGLLEGSGKQVRHIRVVDRQDLKDPRLREFIRLAIRHAQSLGSPVGEIRNQVIVKAVQGEKRRPTR